ncbi:hypothetical protein ACFE04_018315 [Oxalis oulophora]
MEKQAETPLTFLPHRRSHHLHSETYNTLIRIMSHCYGTSQVSLDTPPLLASSLSPIQDNNNNGVGTSGQATEIGLIECGQTIASALENDILPASSSPVSIHISQLASHSPIRGEGDGGGNSRQVTETGVNECEQLVDLPHCLPASAKSCEAIEGKDTGFSDKEMDIDEIDSMMGTDGVDDYFNMDMLVDNDDDGSQEYSKQKTLMDELMDMVTENEEIVLDINTDKAFESLDSHQNGNDGVILPTNQGEDIGHQEISMHSSQDLAQLPNDVQCNDKKVGEDCDLSVDRDMTPKTIGPSENIGNKNFSLENNETEVHRNELEFQSSVVDNGTGQASDLNSEDDETKEGDVSGDLDIDVEILNMEISEDVNSKKELASIQLSAGNGKDSECNPSIMNTVDNVKSSKNVEIEQSGRRNLVYYGEIMDDDKAVGDHDVELKEKENTDVFNKKKRGVLSKEKKIKKKHKERKKRAEKNQKLGVKRLKLETVLKPKPVSVCRHYLKGRCQQSDNCKFSHDAVPLTKSEPCGFFARHLCMKGDECQFDHELSKYPCKNFADKGFCSRGDNCMFSHKIPLKEGTPSTSNVSKAETKPASLSVNSNTKVPQKPNGMFHQKVNASITPPELKIAEALLKQPKGISFLSMVGLSGIEQVSSSPISKGNQREVSNNINEIPKKVAPKGISFLSMVGLSGIEQGSSSPIPKGNQSEVSKSINEIPKKVAPKGINFLSFGKTPTLWKDSGMKKSTGSPLNMEHPLKSSVNKLNTFNQGSSIEYKNDSLDFNIQLPQSASATTPRSDEISRVSQPPAAQRTDFPSIEKNPRNEQQSSNSYVKNTTHDKIEYSLRRLSASPGTSGEGGQKNSAQKALMSTLAFAAKFESQMKMINHQAQASGSNSTCVVDKEKVESIGNELDRASKNLKFLSTTTSGTHGNESKQ